MNTTIRVAATGDAILTHPISADTSPSFLDLVGLLRDADVTVTNVEMVLPPPPRHPATTMHGTPLGVDPALLDEFEWLGINLFGLANNHATDYGTDGLAATLDEFDHRKLPYAGAGRTLREARKPRYLDTAGGRVAFIAAGSSNARLALAADPGIEDAGRPGIAPVRVQKTHYVRTDRFEVLRETLAETGVNVTAGHTTAPGIHFPYPDRNVYDPPPPGGIAVDGVHFVPDDTPRIQTDALTRDVDALKAVVREAARQADIVLVGLHCHEGIQGRWNNDVPAEFLQPLAHTLIDAGAHAIIGHGPHMLRGIEIYHGRPICYSLGNFVFNLETISAFPVEVYEQQGLPLNSTAADLYDVVTGYAAEPRFWESALPEFTFTNGVLTDAVLHPLTLGRDQSRSRRGTPQLAEPQDAQRILAGLADLSRPYGTAIDIDTHHVLL
ncbi:CapA family protein [Mycolicibacterium stellerae]|uniref:CapA family protein n=1 Tax=Mycolicibacterium stellerae TaxID=2358193 RepID=UPI0019D1F592|nr:CapA family protein [Mycolicibacterium stellerae]